MKKNMGTLDKAVRIMIAVVIAVLYFTDLVSGTWAIVLLIISGIFILTSLVSFCPMYLPFGLSSRGKKE